MGKWSHLETALDAEGRPKYQELPPAPGYGERLMARVAEIQPLEFKALTSLYEANYAEKQAREAAVKEAAFEAEAAEIALRFRMRDLGLDRITSGGYTLTPSVEPYPAVEDKSALIAHFIATQPASLQVMHQTLKAQVKSALEGDGEMPPGVGIFLKHTFSRTKAK